MKQSSGGPRSRWLAPIWSRQRPTVHRPLPMFLRLLRSPLRRPLPKVALKGVFLSSTDRGTAMLRVSETNVSITLLPRDRQQRIPIPATRLALLEQTQPDGSAPNGERRTTGSQQRKEPVEMSLESSFFVDGVLFNLEAFTPTTLLLRAVPRDELILVRMEQ